MIRGSESFEATRGLWQVPIAPTLEAQTISLCGRMRDEAIDLGRSARRRRLAALPRTLAALAVLAAMLAGCAAGPHFVRPAAPAVTAYTTAAAAPNLSAGAGERSQRLAIGQGIPAAWWRRFRSHALDAMVDEALANNPTLDAAKATLAQAQQAVLEARGGYYPQIDLGASAERQKGPAFALGLVPPGQSLPQFNLYSVGPTVSFSPDVFGLAKRRVEERQALADAQAYQLAAATLTIAGNTVTEALTLASLRAQIDAATRIIAEDEKDLALVRRKFAAGRVARGDVLAAEAELANDRTLLPELGRQRAEVEDALAVLLGKSPAESTPPGFDLTDFELPAELPLSLPSALARRRPDILAAESLVHARSAEVGIATGRMYPNITLSGSVATAALEPGSLFGSSSGVWALAGGLTAPIFHGGALRAQKRQAVEGFRASLAIYRQTVLAAFGQVADTLRELGHDAELVDAERRALDTADAALTLQSASYAAGRSDLLRLLDAKRGVERARLGYARATAQRYVDSARLFVALGGGSWDGGEEEKR